MWSKESSFNDISLRTIFVWVIIENECVIERLLLLISTNFVLDDFGLNTTAEGKSSRKAITSSFVY